MMLSLARLNHTFTNYCRAVRFRRRIAAQLAELHRRHVDVNVDSIQQWPGDLSHVTLDLRQRTATLARRIIPKTTGARIHRRGQNKRRRKRQRHRCAADRDLLIFKWLPQYFEHAAVKLRQLIEKQYALMGQRDFAGTRQCATTNQSGIANRMMRRSKRTFSYEPC